jgi:hypothetical protein
LQFDIDGIISGWLSYPVLLLHSPDLLMKLSHGTRFSALFIALMFSFLGVVRGGNVLMSNFDEARGLQLPISLSDGTGLTRGGSVQVGFRRLG